MSQPLPYSEQSEKIVLGMLLQRRQGWDEESLDVDHFHKPSHRALFDVLKSEGEEIDLVNLGEKLMNLGLLDQIGGASAITEIYQSCPTKKLFKPTIAGLRDLSARRMGIIAARDIEEAARDIENKEEFPCKLSNPISSVLDRLTNTDKQKDSKAILRGVMDNYAAILNGDQQAMGWEVGLEMLTRAIRGFRERRIVVISGFPSSGKTLLAGQLLIDLARQGVPSMMISFEMTSEEIATRMVCSNGKFDAEMIYDPLKYAQRQGQAQPNKGELQTIRDSFRQINDAPLHFDEATSPTIEQVVTMIRRAHRKIGIKAFAIDYLQLIRSHGHGSKEQELTEISHQIQGVMKELGVLIFVLSQQNQAGDTKYASTTIEDADYVLSVVQNRDKEDDDFMKVTGLRINKDRHTGKGGWTIPMEREEGKLYFKETTNA